MMPGGLEGLITLAKSGNAEIPKFAFLLDSELVIIILQHTQTKLEPQALRCLFHVQSFHCLHSLPLKISPSLFSSLSIHAYFRRHPRSLQSNTNLPRLIL